jgi:hypothetical protein
VTHFHKVLVANGFDKLAERFRAIRPAPILPVLEGTCATVTATPTLGVGNADTVVWMARKWD